MSAELPERDPLADLVSRSLGIHVESVRAEELPGEHGLERRRLRYESKDAERSVIFERSPAGQTLEAQLLPFLARKSDRVPTVHARGLPPPHASLGPWLLIEDVLGAPAACEGNVADIVEAKLAIERAVANDAPALRGLGVPEDARPLPPELAAIPSRLVHGDLRCAVVRRPSRGVVITGWGHAVLGCPTLDVARLALDLERAGRARDAMAVREAYARHADVPGAVRAVDVAIAYLGGLDRR